MATDLQEPIVETQPQALPGDSTAMGLSRGKRARPLFDPPIVRRAIVDSFVKLNPVTLAKNPVMFVVEVGAVLTTILMFRTLMAGGAGFGFEFQIAAWLWFTVLFANFAEAMAEGRGKAQADALRKTKTSAEAKKLSPNGMIEVVSAASLRKGDVCLCEPDDVIPG
jgi:K+-transporting ATPase ATPase B chain